jgi:hypothetical protein
MSEEYDLEEQTRAIVGQIFEQYMAEEVPGAAKRWLLIGDYVDAEGKTRIGYICDNASTDYEIIGMMNSLKIRLEAYEIREILQEGDDE